MKPAETPDPASLDRLHDIIVPDAIGWWPPAPAWYLVLVGLIVWAAYQIFKMVCRYRANAYRREALHLLDGASSVEMLAAVLKRVALAAYPREEVAGLSGDDWLRFLDRTGQTDAFTNGSGKVLSDAAYQPQQSENWEAATNAARAWVLNHKKEAVGSGKGSRKGR